MSTMKTSQSAFSKEELISCGYGKLFGIGNPQLPIGDMLMVDRVTHISSEGGNYDKGEVIAELDIHADLWFFHCHFPSDPVMPGCLGLDAMWQLVGFFLGWRGNQGRGRALGVDKVRFSGQILPDAGTVSYRLHIKRLRERQAALAVADGTVAIDGREIYYASDLRVGLFSNLDQEMV